MPNAKPPRRTPSDAELAKLAEVAPSDVDRAIALWKRRVSSRGKGLVEAQTATPKELKPHA